MTIKPLGICLLLTLLGCQQGSTEDPSSSQVETTKQSIDVDRITAESLASIEVSNQPELTISSKQGGRNGS